MAMVASRSLNLFFHAFSLSIFICVLLFPAISSANNATDAPTASPTAAPTTRVPTTRYPTTPRPTAIDLSRTGEQVVQSIYLYFPFFFVMIFGLFPYLRRKVPKVYSPRQKIVPEKDRVPQLPDGWFSWLDLRRFLMRDEAYFLDLCEKIGSDAVIFLRLLRLGMVIFLWVMVINFVLLLPVYASQFEPSKNATIDAINKFSISHIPANVDSRYMWAPTIVAYITTIVGGFAFLREWRFYMEVRWKFLTLPLESSYTVLVERIPEHLRSRDALTKYFEKVALPGKVLAVELIDADLDTSALEAAVHLRKKVCEALEKARMRGWKGPSEANWGSIGPSHIGEAKQVLEAAGEPVDFKCKANFWGNLFCCCYDRPLGGSFEENVVRLAFLNDLVAKLKTDVMARRSRRNERNIALERKNSGASNVSMGSKASRRSRAGSVSFQNRDSLGERVVAMPTSVHVANTVLKVANKFKALRQRRKEGENTSETQSQDGCEEGDPTEEKKAPPKLSVIAPLASAAKISIGAISKWSVNMKRFATRSAVGDMENEQRVLLQRSAAFVTFSSIRSASTITHLPVTSVPQRLLTMKAPDVPDVKWRSVGTATTIRVVRSWIVYSLATILLIPGFGFLVTGIGLLFNPESLNKTFPKLYEFFVDDLGSFGTEVLAQIAPILLVISIQIVPLLLTLIIGQEGKPSWSSANLSFARKYYIFLAVNVFLFYSAGEAILSDIQKILDDPKEMFQLLANSIPQASNFYIAYLIFKLFVITPLTMLRFPDFILSLLRPLFCGSSTTLKERRTRRGGCTTIDFPGRLHWGKIVPDFLLVFLITLTFSTISPLILPAGMLYFAVNFFVYHQQLLFVYTRGDGVQGGGMLWPFMFRMMCFAFIIYHLVTISVFSLKLGLEDAKVYLMIPLLVADVAMMVYCVAVFNPVCEALPLFTAVSADETFGAMFHPSKIAYRHPSLLAPDTLSPENISDIEEGVAAADTSQVALAEGTEVEMTS